MNEIANEVQPSITEEVATAAAVSTAWVIDTSIALARGTVKETKSFTSTFASAFKAARASRK